jgi:hypothetical protein
LGVALVGLIIVAFAPAAQAAPPREEWQRRLAHRADGVAIDGRGNVYVAASTEWTVDRPSIALLAKYGPAGGLLWTRRWSPANAWTSGEDVTVGPDGSVYLVGDVGVEGFEGGAWFLARYSPDGRLLWRRSTPGWRDLLATGATSVAVGAGMVVIGGYGFGCCSEANDEGFVRAYSLEGDLRWHREVAAPGRLASYHDGVGDVAVGGKGSVYLTGWVETRPRTDVGEPTDVEVLVQKLSADGHEIWTRVLWDHHRRDNDEGVSVAVRGNELVVLAFSTGGWITNPHTRAGHAWLGRFTFDGRVRWSRTWGARPRRAAQPESVTLGSDGTIYVVGAQRDPGDREIEAFARAYAPSGSLRWSMVLGSIPRLWATDVDVERSTLAASVIRLDSGRFAEVLSGRVFRLSLPG